MTTYQSVRAQIAKLEKQAESLRRNELKNVIAKVRGVIAQYGLTAADLGTGGARGGEGAAQEPLAAPAPASRSTATRSHRPDLDRPRPSAGVDRGRERSRGFLIAGAAPAKKKPAAKKRRREEKPAAKKAAAKKTGPRKSGAVEIESGVAVQ